MHDLTGFQRDLLYAIEGLGGVGDYGLPHGLRIRDELSDYYGEQINHGRLYPNLDTLVDEGLVEKEKLDRRANGYRVTDLGRREIEDRRQWENEFVDEPVTADD